MRIQKSVFGILFCLVIIAGCSPYASQDGFLQSSNAGLNASSLMQRQTQVTLREAMENLSDSSHRGLKARGGIGLAGFGLQDVVDQTCQEQADGATITILSSQSNSFAFDSPEKSTSKDIFVNSEVVRSYVLAGEDVECARKAPIIEVELDRDLLDLQLTVKIKRQEKTFLAELLKPVLKKDDENAKTTEPTTPSSTESENGDKPVSSTSVSIPAEDPTRLMTSITATTEGTRNVIFTAKIGKVDDMVSFSKESTGKATRKEKLQTSEGLDEDLSFAIESNFKMVDTYNEKAHDRAVGMGPVQKEITSGSVKSVLQGQGYMETTFNSLKLDFANGACVVKSGQIQSKFYAEGVTTPQKTVDFDVALGSIKVSTTLSQDPKSASEAQEAGLSADDLKKELCTMGDFLD
jgi:hypothetical protein